jgi:hypothetical protein
VKEGPDFLFPVCRLYGHGSWHYAECGLLSAKGGLMMGTKKVGAFSSPLKKAIFVITYKETKVVRKSSGAGRFYKRCFACKQYAGKLLYF